MPINEIRPELFAPVTQLKENVVSSPKTEALDQKKYVNPENIENFGSSPLINNSEWQSPAYERRECLYSDQAVETVVTPRTKTDNREAVSAFKRTRRKKSRIFREPALRLACG